jgi:RHS repeat-associated protein
LTFGPVSQTFDANGNLLTQTDSAGTTTYTWDSRNRLVSISGPSINANFAYDALGRRISKTLNGQATTFHNDGADIVREVGGAGEASYLRTLAIDETFTRSDASGTVTYLSDTLGNTVALADSTGDLRTTYTYAPFGDTGVNGSSDVNPFQYTGRENDGTGLYYYRARYYDPVRARFIQMDPIGLRGGDTNVFLYVRNNPVNLTDAFGLKPKDPRCDEIRRRIGHLLDLLRIPCERGDINRQLKEAIEEGRRLGCFDGDDGGGLPQDVPVPGPERQEPPEELKKAARVAGAAVVVAIIISRFIRLFPPLLPLQVSPF